MVKVGRYTLLAEFASGGMASIHFGRLSGAAGFSRVVAIKRMHKQFARDAEFVKMFVDEARVTASVQHPNVVSVLDVVREDGELFLVMDYVHGESLSKLLRLVRAQGEKVPPPIAARMVAEMLGGLHAAHEARDSSGKPLEIVHRDVSPQNLLVGMDGVSRVVDFGVAKAVGRLQATAEGNLKGKLGYFSPEQLKQDVDRRTDVFAAAIVLWEALSAKRLFVGDTPWDIAQEVAHKEVVPPSELDGEIPKTLSDAVMRGLERDKNARYQTARDFAQAIESALSLATTTEVSVWVQSVAGKELDHKRALLSASEDMADLLPPPSTARPRAQVEREDVPTTGGGAIVADRLAASSRPSASSAPRDGATSPEEIEEPAPSATTPSVELPRARVSAPTAPVGRPNWIIGGAGVLVGVAGIAFALGRTQLSETKGMEQSAVASAAPPADAQSVLSSPPPVMPPIVPSEHPSSSTSAVSSGGPSARPRPSVASDVARSAPIVEVSETPVHGKRCYHIGTPFTGTWCADKSHASGFGCVNLLDNRKHCGSCGKPCNVGEWCQSGKCSVPSCPPGLTLCPGGCVDLSFNASNCGSCGEVCKVRCVNRRCDDK